MDAHTFLTLTLGSSGNYILFAAKQGLKPRQQVFDSIEALLERAGGLDNDGYDVYFSLATFAGTSRTAVEAQELKALFLDLDCGEGKEYKNQAAALRDLQRFCRETHLPKPMIVNSGWGVHVYWPLEEALSVDEWKPVAMALKALCVEKGLKADPAVTADAARVLRIPNTHNHKYSGRVKVEVLKGVALPHATTTLKGLIGEPKGASGQYASVLSGVIKDVPDSARIKTLNDNQASSFRKILERTLKGKGCAQIAYIAKNQTLVSEPLWRSGLSIAKFCEEGDRAACKISNQHPDFDKAEMLAKMEGITGPHTCETFQGLNPTGCEGCPNKGKITSPIQLGKFVKEAEDKPTVEETQVADTDKEPTVWEKDTPDPFDRPKYPKPYFRGANGGVYIRKTIDGEIEEVMVYENDLYVIRRVYDSEVGECAVLRVHLPFDGEREFTVPLSSVTSKDELRKHLSANGIAMVKWDEIMKYITDWVKDLQHVSAASTAHNHFGWTQGAGSFVLGTEELFPNGYVELNPPTVKTSPILPAFKPEGTLEGWKQVMGFYDKPNFELHQFIIGCGFGSVLMEFMPVHACMIHLYSADSGYGKTTALQAALGIWGNPEYLIMEAKDTEAAKMHRTEVCHSLPMCFDELTNEDPKAGSSVAYQISSGKQRGRMQGASNQERLRASPWRLIAMSTANNSLIDKITTYKAVPKAEAQRVLEYEVEKQFFGQKGLTDELSDLVLKNHGHAGRLFIQYVLSNQEEVFKTLKQVQAKVDKVANLTSQNRFWSCGVACSLTGLLIAKNKLKLIDFDVGAVFHWSVKSLLVNAQKRITSFDVPVQDHVTNFLYEHWNAILRIKSTADARLNTEAIITPDNAPRGHELVARYETDTKRVFIRIQPLREWCVNKQIDYGVMVKVLKRDFNASSVKMRLTKGTNIALNSVSVLAMNMDLDEDLGASDTRA